MESKASAFSVLKIKDFRNYQTGAFLSEIGNQMQIVAVAWQIYEITRNPASLGLIGVANLLPIIIFSLIGGLIADKVDRRKVLIVSLVVQGILAATLFGLTIFNLIIPLWIYLILFLISVTQSFSQPVRQSVSPNLVPKDQLMNATSVGVLQYQSAILIGPAIAGFLIGGVGVVGVYFLNAFSFLFFLVALFSIKAPFQEGYKEDVEFSFGAIGEGFKFVISSPILYTTMILDFLVTFFGTGTILMPLFAKDILHVGASSLGLLYSAPALGGILAGLFVTTMRHKIKHQGKTILGSIILYGVATIGFGLSKNLLLSLLFLILVGFGDMLSTIIRNTIRQLVTPDHLRGRMSSILRIFFQGGPQLGEMEAGFLARAIGGPASVVVGGVGVILITSIVVFKSKVLTRYHGRDLNV